MKWRKFPFVHISMQGQNYHLGRNFLLPLVDIKKNNKKNQTKIPATPQHTQLLLLIG